MDIHFTTRNFDLTSALKTFTAEKMAKLSNRYPAIDKLTVTLQIEKVDHIAEATLHFNRADIHASAQADDMYAAIDLLVDKLMEQITRHKEKVTDHHRDQ